MNKTISAWLERYAVALMLTLVLLPLLGKVVAVAMGSACFGWPSLNYHIGYETGFGGRKLVGTLCHLFLPDYVEASHIRILVIAANTLLMALLVWLFARVVRTKASAMMMLLYFLGPFSILAWFDTGMSVIFMETYQLILVVAWLLAYLRWHGRSGFYAFTLVLCVVCGLIHHTFCCTLMPLVAAMLIYDLWDQGRFSWRRLAWTAAIGVAMGILLGSIWLFSRMNLSQEELSARLAATVAPNAYEADPYVLEVLYYQSNSGNRDASLEVLTRYRQPELVLSLLLLLPLLAVLYWPWVRAARKAENHAWRYRLAYLSITLLTMPIFFMATDYGRWFVCWFFGLVVLTLVALTRRDALVAEAVDALYAYFRTHWWVALLLAIYLLGLHALSFEGLKEAINIRQFLL